eukprot:TRINITY_DN4690_c0_g1_i5.p1 TRINITY_DN4690_c0_g1~~TRINITY_DN4690_c0_g1_i5.p1  ORF type:complete len:739 (-),score=137.87 TRINITY_DN4690_c0_g1_i5:314-2530(-)
MAPKPKGLKPPTASLSSSSSSATPSPHESSSPPHHSTTASKEGEAMWPKGAEDAESSHRSGLMCASVFFGSLAIYAATLYPSLPGGDSGELIGVADRLGCAHPPGYPLFTMLGYVFSRRSVPWELLSQLVGGEFFSTLHTSPAMRINLMNAIFAAAANAVLARAAYLVAHSHTAAILAAALYAFSTNVWLHAIGGEVFALNNLFNAVLIYAFIRFRQGPTPIRAYVFAAIAALSLTNQHTSVFPIIVYALYIMFHPFLPTDGLPKCFLLTNEHILKFCGVVALGLTPYAYLPYAASLRPLNCWGNPTTLRGLIRVFLREDYGTFQLAAGGGGGFIEFLNRFALYFYNTFTELAYVGLPAAALGLYLGLRSQSRPRRRFFWITFTAYAFYIITFNYLANIPLDDPMNIGVQLRFYPQATIYICLWSAVGFAQIFKKADFLKLFVVVVISFQIGRNHFYMDMHDNNYIRDYAKITLAKLPQNSLLLCRGDLAINSFRYIQDSENFRLDVVVIDLEILTWDWFLELQRENYPKVDFPGQLYHIYHPDGFNITLFLTRNMRNFPGGIYTHGGFKPGDESHVGYYKEVPYGLSSRVVPANSKFNIDRYYTEARKAFPTEEEMPLPNLDKFSGEMWERTIFVNYFERLNAFANYLMNLGNERKSIKAFEYAAEVYDEVIRRAPAVAPVVLRNAGFCYSQLVGGMDLKSPVCSIACTLFVLKSSACFVTLDPCYEQARHYAMHTR